MAMREWFDGPRILAIAVAATLGVTAGATGSVAQTLADAIAGAYSTNPTLEINRAALRSLDEEVPQAKSTLRPQVSLRNDLSVSRSSRSDDTSTSNQTSLLGSLTLYNGGLSKSQIQSAIMSVESARASLINVEQVAILDAVTAFMDVRRDTQFLSLARNNVRVLNEQLRATRDRFEVGEVTRTDVSQAEAAVAAARSNLATSTGALQQSRAAYFAAIGSEAERPSPPPPAPAVPKTIEEAVQIAMREHPSLRAAQFTERSAEWDVEIARAGAAPVVTLSGSVFVTENIGQRVRGTNLANRGAQILLRTEIPLYTGGNISSLIRQATQVVSQRKAESRNTARQIRQQVEIAWAGLRTARASIRSSGQEIAAAKVAFDGVVEEAKFGERTTLDVLDAEQALLNARSNLVASQRDEYVATYNLLSSMGLLTIRHLGLKIDQYDVRKNYDEVKDGPSRYRDLKLDKILDRWGK